MEYVVVIDMSSMFFDASAFNGDIFGWNTSSVTDMSYMFEFASAFNGDISGWNTSSVTDMSYMFFEAESFNHNLCAWSDIFPYTNATDIFLGSGCAFEDTPKIDQRGPFCASSCN